MQLNEILPELAQELARGLQRIGEDVLAKSIHGLEIHGRCDCGQHHCGTFYTRPRSEWLGKPLRQVIPEVHRLIALDLCVGDIVCVEFLGRADVVAVLDEHLGRTDKPQA